MSCLLYIKLTYAVQMGNDCIDFLNLSPNAKDFWISFLNSTGWHNKGFCLRMGEGLGGKKQKQNTKTGKKVLKFYI